MAKESSTSNLGMKMVRAASLAVGLSTEAIEASGIFDDSSDSSFDIISLTSLDSQSSSFDEPTDFTDSSDSLSNKAVEALSRKIYRSRHPTEEKDEPGIEAVNLSTEAVVDILSDVIDSVGYGRDDAPSNVVATYSIMKDSDKNDLQGTELDGNITIGEGNIDHTIELTIQTFLTSSESTDKMNESGCTNDLLLEPTVEMANPLVENANELCTEMTGIINLSTFSDDSAVEAGHPFENEYGDSDSFLIEKSDDLSIVITCPIVETDDECNVDSDKICFEPSNSVNLFSDTKCENLESLTVVSNEDGASSCQLDSDIDLNMECGNSAGNIGFISNEMDDVSLSSDEKVDFKIDDISPKKESTDIFCGKIVDDFYETVDPAFERKHSASESDVMQSENIHISLSNLDETYKKFDVVDDKAKSVLDNECSVGSPDNELLEEISKIVDSSEGGLSQYKEDCCPIVEPMYIDDKSDGRAGAPDESTHMVVDEGCVGPSPLYLERTMETANPLVGSELQVCEEMNGGSINLSTFSDNSAVEAGHLFENECGDSDSFLIEKSDELSIDVTCPIVETDTECNVDSDEISFEPSNSVNLFSDTKRENLPSLTVVSYEVGDSGCQLDSDIDLNMECEHSTGNIGFISNEMDDVSLSSDEKVDFRIDIPPKKESTDIFCGKIVDDLYETVDPASDRKHSASESVMLQIENMQTSSNLDETCKQFDVADEYTNTVFPNKHSLRNDVNKLLDETDNTSDDDNGLSFHEEDCCPIVGTMRIDDEILDEKASSPDKPYVGLSELEPDTVSESCLQSDDMLSESVAHTPNEEIDVGYHYFDNSISNLLKSVQITDENDVNITNCVSEENESPAVAPKNSTCGEIHGTENNMSDGIVDPPTDCKYNTMATMDILSETCDSTEIEINENIDELSNERDGDSINDCSTSCDITPAISDCVQADVFNEHMEEIHGTMNTLDDSVDANVESKYIMMGPVDLLREIFDGSENMYSKAVDNILKDQCQRTNIDDDRSLLNSENLVETFDCDPVDAKNCTEDTPKEGNLSQNTNFSSEETTDVLCREVPVMDNVLGNTMHPAVRSSNVYENAAITQVDEPDQSNCDTNTFIPCVRNDLLNTTIDVDNDVDKKIENVPTKTDSSKCDVETSNEFEKSSLVHVSFGENHCVYLASPSVKR